MSTINNTYGTHNASQNIRWSGNGETASWTDPDNWNGGQLPQFNSSSEATVNGHAVVDSAIAAQVVSLTVGNNSSIAIIAQNEGSSEGNVFSTQGTQMFSGSQLVIDTPSRVELGGVFQLNNSDLTIMNNKSNVIFDDSSICGSGNINLVNSTLGSMDSPVGINSPVSITLQGGSTYYAQYLGNDTNITFDPNTQNAIYLNGTESVISSKISGFSQNSHIGLDSGMDISSTNVSENPDGSYSLDITLSNGRSVTISDINFADGYVPSGVTVVKNADGSEYIDFLGGSQSYNTDQTLSSVISSAKETEYNMTATTTDSPYMQHTHSITDRWTGSAGDNNWYNTDNWSNGTIPQSSPSSEAVIGETWDAPDAPAMTVNANVASYSQITSMGIGCNVTLNINATTSHDGSYVFATQGLEMFENSVININTPDAVELGGVTMLRYPTSTININNNDGKVAFDNSGISGDGKIVLNNSTLGSQENRINIGSNNLYLSNNSTAYLNVYGAGASITVDPDTVNTIVFSGSSSPEISAAITGVSDKTIIGINDDGNVAPASINWTANSDGSYTMSVAMSDGKTFKLDNVSFANSSTPPDYKIVGTGNGEWLIETESVNNIYVWNGPDQGGNPNLASNWLVNGQTATTTPGASSIVEFQNGHDVQLQVNTPYAFNQVDVTNGTKVSFTSSGTTIQTLNVSDKSNAYITAPNGNVTVNNLNNNGTVISSSNVNVANINNGSTGNITLQNGVNISNSYVNNNGLIEVWGNYVQKGVTYTTSTAALSSNDASGDLIIHSSDNTCFAENTRILLVKHGKSLVKKVGDLKFDDELASGGQVKWLGRKLIPAGTSLIRIDNLTITPDHLILQDDVLVPSQECRGAKEVITDKEQYVYHFQTEKHTLVCANGVWADTMMYDPSREPMETVFGELNKETARWGINTARFLRTLKNVA